MWVSIFAFGIFLPLSIPKDLSALRFSSAFGVMCTLYLLVVIIYSFFKGIIVESPSENVKNAKLWSTSFSSVVEAIPYITFLYLF